jgi:pimeloyl-ACP methyl ester carboxylesterase
VVAISAGLLEENLEQHGTSGSSSSSSSCDAAAVLNSAGTPVLVTYGDRDEVVSRQRVDRWARGLQEVSWQRG